MKKIIIFLVLILLFSGCKTEKIEVNNYILERFNVSDSNNPDFREGIQNINAVFENEDFCFKVIQTCTFGSNIYFLAECEMFGEFKGRQLCHSVDKLIAGDEEVTDYVSICETVDDDSEKDYWVFSFYNENFFKESDKITLVFNDFYVTESDTSERKICGPVEISWNLEKAGDTKYFNSISKDGAVEYMEVSPFFFTIKFAEPVKKLPEIFVVYHHDEAKIKIEGEPITEEFEEGIKESIYYFGDMLDLSKIDYVEIDGIRYILKDSYTDEKNYVKNYLG